MPKVILLKPLDGSPAGAEREFNDADFARLEKLGAVRRVSDSGRKAAAPVENKAAPRVANKDGAAAADVSAPAPARKGRPRKAAK